jgi:PTS system nitrogen regulatory IIA component
MLTDLLTAARVSVRPSSGNLDKAGALKILASLLAEGIDRDGRDGRDGQDAARDPVNPDKVERVLVEREALQSTGIGDGVAIPHGALAEVEGQIAALLIVPDGLDFDAIDGNKVNLLFALVGPKRATGEHLKTLARISRLLRNKGFRDRLISSSDGGEAYALLVAEEGGGA